MDKQIKIKFECNNIIELNAYPDLHLWKGSSENSRKMYIKEKVREFLVEEIALIVDDLLENSTITYTEE